MKDPCVELERFIGTHVQAVVLRDYFASACCRETAAGLANCKDDVLGTRVLLTLDTVFLEILLPILEFDDIACVSLDLCGTNILQSKVGRGSHACHDVGVGDDILLDNSFFSAVDVLDEVALDHD
jgi:hypothetical protein